MRARDARPQAWSKTLDNPPPTAAPAPGQQPDPNRAYQMFPVLTGADAPEMLALASLTEPGPFFLRTHQMGRFIGIRRQGRLAAMAGERMRFPGPSTQRSVWPKTRMRW